MLFGRERKKEKKCCKYFKSAHKKIIFKLSFYWKLIMRAFTKIMGLDGSCSMHRVCGEKK